MKAVKLLLAARFGAISDEHLPFLEETDLPQLDQVIERIARSNSAEKVLRDLPA